MGSNEQPLESTRQRLDKWLFFARMAKSRSLAQNYIQSGQVKVNGATIRQPSHAVKAGDWISVLSAWTGCLSSSPVECAVGPTKRPDVSTTISRRHGSLPTG